MHKLHYYSAILLSLLGLSVTPVLVLAQTATVSFSENNIVLTVGQSKNVTVTAPGYVYISVNNSPSIAGVNISGTTASIQALGAGTDTVSVCSINNGSTTCSNLNLTVMPNGTNSGTTATSGSNPTSSNTTTVATALTLSTTSIVMFPGQTTNVTIINGTYPYYVQNNSNSSVVTANINNAVVALTAIGIGGSNINICSNPNMCANLYVYIAPNMTQSGQIIPNTAASNPSSPVNTLPNLTSLTITNSTGNGFMATGNNITFGFNTNIAVSQPIITVGNNKIPASGSGTGPFGIFYTVNGTEPQPITFTISLTALNGITNQIPVIYGKPAVSGSLASNPVASAANAKFTEYLEIGSTGSQVHELQSILTELGFYNGPITGKYGSQTKAAVIAYQKKHGLNPLGVVGPATRDLLNSGR